VRGRLHQVTIGLPTDIIDAIDAVAHREDRSRAKAIEHLLRQALKLPRTAPMPASRRRQRAQPLQLTRSLALSL
jgi:hypothetical protein